MTFSIGSVPVQDGAILAPLAAVTSAPFREICLEHRCALAVTEMVASEALVRDVKKIMRRMDRAHNESQLVVQLFGSKPDVMARAAALAVEHANAAVIDINMGCPVRKILGVGAGVALMREPSHAAKIVEEIVAACGSTVPVTVKMRAGWDDTCINAVEVAQRVQDVGASAITVHARTKEQVHRGASRWEVISDVKRAVRVPVIGNGGIKSWSDAASMMAETGCDAVMIGRGAMGNPWLFESILARAEITPSRADRFAVIRRHLDLYVGYAGEGQAAREMRKHLGWYLRGMPGSAMVRDRLQSMHHANDILEAMDAYESALASGRAHPSAADFGVLVDDRASCEASQAACADA